MSGNIYNNNNKINEVISDKMENVFQKQKKLVGLKIGKELHFIKNKFLYPITS